MKYKNIEKAVFLSRISRFTAEIKIGDEKHICHVKNTGRCKELLLPGAEIFAARADSAKRSTKFDLIGVYKGDNLVNVDSQIPNQVFQEWVLQGNLFDEITFFKREQTYRNSRLDFYIETAGKRKIFAEIKGVTLEEDGTALFPDAPTQRGLKHIRELCRSMQEGYEAYLVFIIQMKGIHCFKLNDRMQQEFGDELRAAKERGLKIVAVDCIVTSDCITADNLVNVIL